MKEIARILKITPRTVAFHKYGMMGESGIRTSAELVQFAVKQHLVSVLAATVDPSSEQLVLLPVARPLSGRDSFSKRPALHGARPASDRSCRGEKPLTRLRVLLADDHQDFLATEARLLEPRVRRGRRRSAMAGRRSSRPLGSSRTSWCLT